MARKYILYPIQTIKDWQGEDWDVHEERKISDKITLQYGWLYCAPRQGSKSLIVSSELAEIFRIYSWREMIDVFGISSSTASKIRRELNLSKIAHRRDRDWIIQHQNEILYSSFLMLLDKYGLHKGIVKSYSNYLISDVGIKRKTTRHHESQFAVEKTYEMHKVAIAQCKSFRELNAILHTDDYTARKFHELACAELNLPSMSERHLKNLSNTWTWRYQHRNTILNAEMTIIQIATQLNTSSDEIYNARKALRRRLKIKETIGVVRVISLDQWVLQHAIELKTLKISQLQQKFQISSAQIKYRRKLLKQLQKNETQSVA